MEQNTSDASMEKQDLSILVAEQTKNIRELLKASQESRNQIEKNNKEIDKLLWD